jgi:tellurite resistance protein
MATQIVIANGDSIVVDNEFRIPWADKGKNWVDSWCPSNYHYVIWNTLSGQNEIQTKDPATNMMTGNTDLNATSDAVGSTTVADLLTWAETRKGQIEAAKTALQAAIDADEKNGTTDAEGKTWIDYDSNYS